MTPTMQDAQVHDARGAPASSLPSFRKPPVVEVAIAAQFGAIRGLTGPWMGVLWQKYRDSFPKMDVQPALDPLYERPSGSAEPLTIKFETIPAPRAWFFSSDEAHLVQVQQDRFVFNWRLREGRDYPRYRSVEASFREYFDTFRDFLADEQLGEPALNQWELTYVNHIPAGHGWRRHGELGAVLPTLGSWEGTFLPEPEDIALRIRYAMPDADGAVSRLHIVAEPLFEQSGKPALALTLTARGSLEPRGVGSLQSRLAVGHEWIVRGFADITSKTMHRYWEREK